MSKYIMLFNCEFIEEDTNAVKHEKGMFIGEKMSDAVKTLEYDYGNGIEKVLLEYLDDDFVDTEGTVTEEQMRKALRQLNPLKNEEV